MFNKLNKWFWWVIRDREVGEAFEDAVASLPHSNDVTVELVMIVVSEKTKVTKAYQKYLAYCFRHDVLDREVRRCAKLVNQRNHEQDYERAVECLYADVDADIEKTTKKKEKANDWN